MKLSDCIDKLVTRHGGLRKLARAAGLDAGYLSRLRTETRDAPSDRVLEALGLERVVSYRLSRTKARPIEAMSPAAAAAYHGGEDDGA